MAGERSHAPRLLWVILAIVMVAIVGLVAFPPVTSSRELARHSTCRNNLKLIGLALHNYQDDWGSFPPAFVADNKGRPIYGWRTLLLPYLEQGPLFDEYRFDEAWDGPHNAKLRKRFPSGAMPFSCPAAPNYGRPQTNYLAVVGPTTAWPGSRPAKLGEDFPDGPSQTILVVEVEGSGIHWLEPRDLNFDEMSFTLNNAAENAISSQHKMTGSWPWSRPVSYVHVLFGDGEVKQLRLDTAPETIRALLTANGAEAVKMPP
jgi:type II secretory pathway pseudopilin PulG